MDKKQYSVKSMSAICSNMAKACEKQSRPVEMALFKQLGSYYESLVQPAKPESFSDLSGYISVDLVKTYEEVAAVAASAGDRGALRCMTWGKKVTSIHKSVLARYEKQGDALLEGSNLYVCEACGFIAIAPSVPELCPICKAPASRFTKV